MSQRAATIESLAVAFEVVKATQADGVDWNDDYRPFARQALAEIIELQMAAAVDRYLDQLDAEDEPDRRNGYYQRHLLTTLGDIELCVPRTRRFCPTAVLRAYSRRTPEIDRVIRPASCSACRAARWARRCWRFLAKKSPPRR
jgi:transposase-like protein